MVKTESNVQLKKEDLAPDFTLPDIGGRMVSLASLAKADGPIGKVSAGRATNSADSPVDGLFVLFMCNHCPYVKARMGEVVELHREFKERIAFVGINSNDPEYPGEGHENMKAFSKERGIAFPYLLDEDGNAAHAYGATCTPDPFLFDRDGRLVFHGRLTDALEPDEEVKERTMRENMQKLLAGLPIEPWFNPSLGCSIKFKKAGSGTQI